MSKRLIYVLAVSVILPVALILGLTLLVQDKADPTKSETYLAAGKDRPLGTWSDVAAFPNVTLAFSGSGDPNPNHALRLKRASAVGYPWNGKVYVLGGRDRGDGDDIGNSWIWEYTPGNPGSWLQKSGQIDSGLYGSRFTSGMATAVLTDANGPRIYAVGGMSVDSVATGAVRIYNPNTDSVTSGDAWPANPPRVPGAWAVYNNKLYIFGGHTAKPSASNTLYADTWVFDPNAPAGSRWQQIASANLSVARAYMAGAALDGYIYAIGGDLIGASATGVVTPVNTVERMDPSSGSPTWQPVASLPYPRGDIQAWAYDTSSGYEIAGRILVAGGGLFPGSDAQAYLYNPSTNSWGFFQEMPRPRRNYAAAQLNGILYAFGGYDPQPGYYTGSNLSAAYNASGPGPAPLITPTNTPFPSPTNCANVQNYTFTASTGATIDPGTAYVNGTRCQTCVQPLTLPFPVQLYGKTFTSAFVGSTGVMQFGSNATFWINRALPSANHSYTLMPYWDDLSMTSGANGVYTSVTGTAPNRVFNVEWRASSANFEIRFFEGQTSIEYIYASGNGSSATVGVQKDGSYYTQYSYNTGTLTAGTKLTLSTAPCGTPGPTDTPVPSNTATRTATGTPPTNTPTTVPSNTATRTNTPVPTATVCGFVQLINENFESGTLGAFVSSVGTCVPGGCGWVNTTTNPHGGTKAAFAPDLGNVSDQYLTTVSSFGIPAGTSNATMTFWHSFDLENTFDGGVLEYSTDGGTNWLDAGALITSGGYNGTISVNFNSPISGRQAWTGNGSTYAQVTVNLTSLAGQANLKIRFREANDSSVTATGWTVDDVLLTMTTSACSSVTPATATSTTVPPTNTATRTSTGTAVATNTPSRTATTGTTGTATATTQATSTATMVMTITPATSTPMTATSTAIPTATACTIEFTDVPPGSTFYDFIHCLACNGVLGGYPDNTFRPGNAVTRGQIAKVVANAAGFDDTIPETQQTYTDVLPGSTFWVYIERMSNYGIMSGYPCGTVGEPCDPQQRPYFRPSANATRGQIAKIVANAAGFNDTVPAGTQSYADVVPNSTFWVFIERLMINRPNVMNGYACGGPGEPCDPQQRPYFRPNANATRGQTAKIVSNTFFPDCVSVVRVIIKDFAYHPSDLTIVAGTTVRFINRDDVAHTATENSEVWETGLLDQNQYHDITFVTPASYGYFCEPHPWMMGTLNVVSGAGQK